MLPASADPKLNAQPLRRPLLLEREVLDLLLLNPSLRPIGMLPLTHDEPEAGSPMRDAEEDLSFYRMLEPHMPLRLRVLPRHGFLRSSWSRCPLKPWTVGLNDYQFRFTAS